MAGSHRALGAGGLVRCLSSNRTSTREQQFTYREGLVIKQLSKLILVELLRLSLLVLMFLTGSMVRAADPLRLSRADYADRAHAAWVAQMAAVYLGFPFEHQAGSVKWLKDYPMPYTHSIIDDDWYYEMSALPRVREAWAGHDGATTRRAMAD